MQIAENLIVGLTYELKVSKEDEDSVPFSVEVRDQEDPFYFLFGKSGLPEKFEAELADKKQGDHFKFVLEVEEAYGTADDELIVNIPKDQLTEERGFKPEMLQEGNFLPLVDEEGYSMQAKVLKDMGEELILDFNHPLVDFKLHFDGEVLEVREASEEELAFGHVDGSQGHQN
ncbi:peptidylprolyl isomerase [Echinicola jeungdonensis]|uniref:peptidylprolyl isomerase n=1 Tax=Echinicola jeungdonensis TaxID=709343 RepID=A0ABV5J6F9_9BACT|nr:peptidylprolyl isomerase [Echinicola jeungdonensis]MDN3669786.1 peptidylprolyl isomerase [Echinicola jeungdonensis]